MQNEIKETKKIEVEKTWIELTPYEKEVISPFNDWDNVVLNKIDASYTNWHNRKSGHFIGIRDVDKCIAYLKEQININKKLARLIDVDDSTDKTLFDSIALYGFRIFAVVQHLEDILEKVKDAYYPIEKEG